MSLILRIIFDACTLEQSTNLYSKILLQVRALNKGFREAKFHPYWKIENSYEALFILDFVDYDTLRRLKEKILPGNNFSQVSEIIWDRNRETLSNPFLMHEIRWLQLEVIE